VISDEGLGAGAMETFDSARQLPDPMMIEDNFRERRVAFSGR